jgi:WD40 repeat protein
VQIWDVASGKEVRRFDTPPGHRGSADYAQLTPDWTTLYVPVEQRTGKRAEKDGKVLLRLEESGQVRVWDVASGKEKTPLQPAAGSAPVLAKLAPDGHLLVCIERCAGNSADKRSKHVTVVWDLAAGKKAKLCEGYAYPSFAPDGKTAVVSLYDEDGSSTVKVLDMATGRELATVHRPDKERYFSVGPVSPDGAVVAVYLGGKKGAPFEVWFFDARTLEGRGKLTGTGDPDGHGWGSGAFTPDAKRFAALDGAGNVVLWNVAGRTVERTLPYGGNRSTLELAVSPDGKTLAIGWAPKGNKDPEGSNLTPDPRDLPQPRVSLIDLAGDAPMRVLVAPHGYVGSLAFAPDGKMLAFGGTGAVHLFDLTKSVSGRTRVSGPE